MSSLLKYLLVLVVLALQSCGGLSSGFLSAAPIDNASCSIYKITTEGTQGDELAFNDSDKGVVTFINVGYSGRALIQCSAGGTYTDEATGNEKQSPILRVALNFIEGEKFAITPLTEIAVQLDNNLNNVIDIHNDTVAKVFGLSGKSITAILPTDIDKISLTNDDSGDYAMILAMLSKLEAEDTSNDSSLSKVIDLLKIDLVDGTLEKITIDKLIVAFDSLKDKFKNTNIEKIKEDIIGRPLLVDLPVKNLISDSFVTFAFRNTGGVANRCSSKPNLPSGLTVIHAGGSCKIFGAPTVLQDAATYTIKATNFAGDSTATVSIGVSLGIPRNLVATKGDAVITLTWSPVSGATGYKIYYSQNEINISNLGSASLVQVSSGTSETIGGLTSDTLYHFIVTAVKDSAEGPLNARITATPMSKPSLTNLSDKYFTLHKNIIAFMFSNTGTAASSCSSQPSLPNGLMVERNSNNGGCEIFGTPTVLQIAKTYAIKATNAIGDDTATVSISVDLNTPKNLIANKGNAKATIALTWDVVSGATGYQVYYAKQSFSGISLSNYASLNGGSLLQNITDNKKTISNLINGVQYYFVVTAVKDTFESGGSGEATATSIGALNDTGITWGGGYATSNNATCTGVEISAQDCSHGRDAKAATGTLTKVGGGKAGFDFTKLGSTGNVLSVQNAAWKKSGAGTESAGTKWSCVRDNVTGLVWEVKTDEGVEDSDTTDDNHTNIHHKGNGYRWGGKTAIDRDRANRVGTYNDDWTGLVDGTNAEKFCGSDNWRMPTIGELYSIADLSIAKPVIDGDYFPNTVTSSFWSSSPYSENDTNAWIVDFYLGYVYHYRRSDKYYQVRLVHSKQ
ncbi:hypothetical protein [uncultured Gammaproteobacteria bacterium]|nr:hypothetical protein [uncultured Gammaproteobacteria bacterium]